MAAAAPIDPLARAATRGNKSGTDVTAEALPSDEEREFLVAVDRYKRVYARKFPTWTEVLAIAHGLGYRRVAEPHPTVAKRLGI